MKSGPKPKGNVSIKWSSEFSYAIGLITADGCLSKDGRHISLTSKDKVQVETFKRCLNLSTKTSIKFSGSGNVAYHTQFGDVLFYKFLLSIGLSPAKSKTIVSVQVPNKYFLDFFRGYFDGDGCSFSFFDSVFPDSYRFYISFTSGSLKYLEWLRGRVSETCEVKGYLCYYHHAPYFQLRYAKKEAILISKKMYHPNRAPYLERKFLKIQKSLNIIRLCRGGEIGRHAVFRTL